jgi:hypothetical protein
MNKAIVAAKIDTFVENGRKEITTKKQLEKFPIGSLISYMNIDNVFRSGGFIIKFTPDYFIYITPDFSTKYRARYSHILKMWAGNVYNTQNDIVSIVPASQDKTNFSVVVNDIPIYYAKKSFDAKRFKHTAKYKKIIEWCTYFNQPI